MMDAALSSVGTNPGLWHDHAVPWRQALERAANGALSPLGIRIVRHGRAPTIGGRRLSDDRVIADAGRQGISPGELLERLFAKPGRAQEIVDRMIAGGALSRLPGSVLEIGAGSGVFIEAVRRRAVATRYEVYEIEANRAAYLARAFPIVAQPTDGETLGATATGSIDLVHAHGVFVTLQFLTTCSYFREIARVTAPGGFVAFDVMTESCLDEPEIQSWLASRLRYPSLLSRGYVLDFFTRRGFVLVNEFVTPLLVRGRSLYLIFRRPDGDAPGV